MSNLPKIALGTWLMGGDSQPDPNNNDQKDIEAIRLAVEQDITLIDTAQYYAMGKCEELIGEALSIYPRDKYQILTKQWKGALDFDGVIKGCHESIKRLSVEYIDYFVCHVPNPEIDMREFFKAANQLYKDGFIHNVGVSNFGPNMLQLALDNSELPISLNQVCFSLTDDDVFSTGTYDFCVKHEIPIQAYRTLADVSKNQVATKILEEIAAKHEVTPHQVALAYLNSYREVTFTIRASSKEHWDQIKAAMELKLSDAEIKTLRDSHKDIKGRFRTHLLD